MITKLIQTPFKVRCKHTPTQTKLLFSHNFPDNIKRLYLKEGLTVTFADNIFVYTAQEHKSTINYWTIVNKKNIFYLFVTYNPLCRFNCSECVVPWQRSDVSEGGKNTICVETHEVTLRWMELDCGVPPSARDGAWGRYSPLYVGWVHNKSGQSPLKFSNNNAVLRKTELFL